MTYAYLQAQDARDPEFMRGGTIYPVGEGSYSYGEIHRASRWALHRISYILKPQDVARFHLYPRNRDVVVNRINERPSRVDLRSVTAVDPLHRPLYILHPSSLAIRAYHGDERQLFVEVASLQRPVRSPLRSTMVISPKPPTPNATILSMLPPIRRVPDPRIRGTSRNLVEPFAD